MKSIEINGESIPVTEARELIRMLFEDAKQVAGEFHNMERSDKFRVNWPSEYEFADRNGGTSSRRSGQCTPSV